MRLSVLTIAPLFRAGFEDWQDFQDEVIGIILCSLSPSPDSLFPIPYPLVPIP
jgi:hypothetical protein